MTKDNSYGPFLSRIQKENVLPASETQALRGEQFKTAYQEFTQSKYGAVRSADANGTRYDLISPIGLRRLAETYKEGADKYGDNNWLNGFPAGDLLNHLMKHIDQFRQGDQSEDHLAHAAWGLFALMHFQETRPELVDGPYMKHPLEHVGA